MPDRTARTLAALVVLSGLLQSCTTTSGSQRLDETGERMADAGLVAPRSVEPASSGQLLAALRGGIVGRIGGLTLSASDRARALEAEYKVLELVPAGQSVSWQGAGASGQVMAAAPYQVGQQNCRQVSHNVTATSGRAFLARGAACRNADGSWTPLS